MVTWDALDRLCEIARAAGAAALAHYDGPIAAEAKADASPVTVADRAAHRVIVDALERELPRLPVLSEEGTIPPFPVRRGWSAYWLVDPLDGTKEFLQRNGEFTVNIALIDAARPVLGVVYAPALDRLYAAGAGLGAWRQEGPETWTRLRSSPPAPGAALVVAESRSHASAELDAYLATVKVSRRVRIGSSLKFCLVAEGTADIYPRFGPTMEWDTAAGDCVYRSSGRGGERSSPLVYNTESLRHGPFIIGDR